MASSSTTFHQWLSLVGIIWLQAINGTNTNFPAYSSQLKQLLSISQLQLNNLAFASDAGKLFGFFSGMAAIYLPLWLVLMIGTTLGLVGYGVQYLFTTNQISSLSYWHVFLLTVIAGNSICWINTVCYVVTIRNFSSDQQVAVGITTSYQGLSAKIYNTIVGAVSMQNKRASTFLLLNSAIPLIVGLIASPMLREIDDDAATTTRSKKMGVGFVVMFGITIATGVYSVITSLEFVDSKISQKGNLFGIVVTLLVPLLVPFSMKIYELVGSWQTNRENSLRVCVEESNNNNNNSDEVKESEEEDVDNNEKVVISRSREEIGVKMMIRRVDFWLYFFVYLFGATLGLVFLNNLGQIAESRGCSGTSSLVSLSSSFGFFGRLMPSLMDYFYRGKYVISRPASMVAMMAPTAGAFFLLLNKTHLALYTSTAIIGVCTGAITSISVSTTKERSSNDFEDHTHHSRKVRLQPSKPEAESFSLLYHFRGKPLKVTPAIMVKGNGKPSKKGKVVDHSPAKNSNPTKDLFKRFNIIDNTIHAVAGEVQITTEKIGEAFGLKYTGTTYPEKVNTKELSAEDEQIFMFFQGKSQVALKELVFKTPVDTEANRGKFNRAFLLYIQKCFFLPTSAPNVTPRALPTIFDLQNTRKKIWALHIHNFLLEEIEKAKENNASFVSGCCFALMVIYLHKTHFGKNSQDAEAQPPWIQYWTGKSLWNRMKQEKTMKVVSTKSASSFHM
ncbi:hypothetical protein PIB30_012898 [Stylosanthes scabra]|uniref:Nodulin-like domain-containing protein n=1 Tax=Stylosanthes scabra TaxID=79078 RepID=A0ABU6X818_9FABA|nr:hypothetical protein [Stylosanthes scabra]